MLQLKTTIYYTAMGLILFSLACAPVWAQSRVMVLTFELKDLTPLANAPKSIHHTYSIKPLLETELQQFGHAIVNIDPIDYNQANQGFGYLFAHHDIAAKLAQKYDAEYVLVGRLHKPSFLFAYLIVHLVDVHNGTLIAEFVQEAKGRTQEITKQATKALAERIQLTLSKHTQIRE